MYQSRPPPIVKAFALLKTTLIKPTKSYRKPGLIYELSYKGPSCTPAPRNRRVFGELHFFDKDFWLFQKILT